MASGPDASFSSDSEQGAGVYQYVAELSTAVLGPLWAAFVSEGAEVGRVVAARRIDLGMLPPGAVERFESAAAAASRIRDPRLAATLGVVRTQRELVVVSEYVDGESLATVRDLCAQTRMPMPVAVALRIPSDAVTGLRAARNGWTNAVAIEGPEHVPLLRAVFGGLSPEHVFLASYGEAVLSEVGVTGVAASLPKIGRHPTALAYRAPEQLEAAQPDERSDIFSLGIILWEMLAMRPLFGEPSRFGLDGAYAPLKPGEGSSVAERLRDKVIPRLDALERVGSLVPTAVADLVELCLQRDPHARFQTVEEVQQALTALGDALIATPEQVAIFVERLARDRIEARRNAIELVLKATRGESKPPRSSRPTFRPDDGPAFPDSERPTLHHVGVLDSPLGGVPKGPVLSNPHAPALNVARSLLDPVVQAGGASGAVYTDNPSSVAGGDVVEFQVDLDEQPTDSSLMSPMTADTTAHLAGSRRGTKAIVAVLAVAALVGVAVGGLILLKGRSANTDTAASRGTERPAGHVSTTRTKPSEQGQGAVDAGQAPTASSLPERPKPAVVARHAQPAAPASGTEEPKGSATRTGRHGSATGPTRTTGASSSRSKTQFRPSGI